MGASILIGVCFFHVSCAPVSHVILSIKRGEDGVMIRMRCCCTDKSGVMLLRLTEDVSVAIVLFQMDG